MAKYKILKDDYRKIYFDNTKPIIKKGEEYYKCLYCGKLFPREEIEVDHIIPKSRFMGGILWNPNKYWNLGAACRHCNASKSKKVDRRIIIGFRNKFLKRFAFNNSKSNIDNKESKIISILIVCLFILAYLINQILFILRIPLDLIYDYLTSFLIIISDLKIILIVRFRNKFYRKSY